MCHKNHIVCILYTYYIQVYDIYRAYTYSALVLLNKIPKPMLLYHFSHDLTRYTLDPTNNTGFT